MPCSKFISIRLEPSAKETRVYVDDMTEFVSLKGLKRFTVRAHMKKNTAQGATVAVDALRWPPQGYDSPITFSLGAQWPFGTKYYEGNDGAGAKKGRSFTELEFAYNESAGTLSWNQKNAATPGELTGSIKFNERTPVWYVVLELDPKSTGAKGELIVNGQDVTR